MRALVSLVVTAALAVVFGAAAPKNADAVPVIDFGRGVGAATPAECAYNAVSGDLDCTASVGTTLSFTVWIHIGTEGAQAWSFGATWDTGSINELTNTSAAQTSIATLETGVDPGPPPVTLETTWNISGTDPVVEQSSADPTGSGYARNFEAFANSGAGTGPYLAVAGLSFRAGYLGFTVDSEGSTSVQLGWFEPNSDAFGDYQASGIVPVFHKANINAPEPGTTLLMGLGLLGLVLASRSSRKK